MGTKWAKSVLPRRIGLENIYLRVLPHQLQAVRGDLGMAAVLQFLVNASFEKATSGSGSVLSFFMCCDKENSNFHLVLDFQVIHT
jgi:hypothetical protein